MAELKTKKTELSPVDFLNQVEDEQKREDCFAIVEMMKKATKKEAKMWGSSIVGFDQYSYTYESGHSGEMCLVGFSPRSKNITLYLMMGINNEPALMERLGKHKTGKGCLYINKLSDVDVPTLEKLIKASVKRMKEDVKSKTK